MQNYTIANMKLKEPTQIIN